MLIQIKTKVSWFFLFIAKVINWKNKEKKKINLVKNWFFFFFFKVSWCMSDNWIISIVFNKNFLKRLGFKWKKEVN